MKQWDIVKFPFREEGAHPAVILSNDERCQNPDLKRVNTLLCIAAKVNCGPKSTEVVLDQADGPDWKTMVRCDLVHLLPKHPFRDARGEVSSGRRREIARKLVEVLRLPL
jgi:mRNA-degrading endonuclease toxin of MazEF toxin-antitoxin module